MAKKLFDPSFPFYCNDWLSSARVSAMTLAEQGAFVRLLCHCWASQDASIEDDEQSLASLSGLGENWKKSRVRKEFVEHPDIEGKLTNEKLFALWKDREAYREKMSTIGKASAEKKKKQRDSAIDRLKETSKKFQELFNRVGTLEELIEYQNSTDPQR